MNKENISEYVKKYAMEHFGDTEKEIDEAFEDTVGVAYYIARVAHDGQRRANGAPYIMHPLAIYHRYRNIINIEASAFDPYELADEYDIPFWGVQELCLLHDVVEDTEFTLKDIEQMYKELNQELYFKTYIENQLWLITHEKDDDYETYMKDVLCIKASALVKLLDLTDNLNVLSLDKFEDDEYERALRYVKYLKMINDKFHFVEKFNKYRRACLG